MPNDDAVDRNLLGMDELDFVGWNNADWTGVFAHYTPTMYSWTGKDRPRPTASRSTSRP